MSASEPETAIFTVDTRQEAETKVMNAFTGGRVTVEEQRRLGGQADICPVYHYYEFLMEQDDRKLIEIYQDCRFGRLLCGDCKAILSAKVVSFLAEHQRRREAAKRDLDKVMLRD